MNKTRLVELVGWYGTTAILGAYALVSFGIINAESITFQLLNLSGALGIIVISFVRNVKQTIVLNLFWAAIAILALARIVTL